MLELTIGAKEGYDESKQEFVTVEGTVVALEHSLLSVSKWESKYEKPFLDPETKMTVDQTIDYIRMMAISSDVPPELYEKITNKEINVVNEYIKAKMTATWFSETPGPTARSREVITAELMYYWLIALNIPFDPVQGWHLNRLLTLVKVCNQKNQPQKNKKNFTRSDLDARRALNQQRKAKMGTLG